MSTKPKKNDMTLPSVNVAENLGQWLSAALDDPAVCSEMKQAISGWFNAGCPPLVRADERLRTALEGEEGFPTDDAYPFYELKFIQRVLNHEGKAPIEDWKTARGMAREIFVRWHPALSKGESK